MSANLSPAHLLVGHTLCCGWKLVQIMSRAPGGTGGNFGVGYIAEKNGERAFVKAIDFVDALSSGNPLKELADLTSRANFEREALEFCGIKRMSKVVRLIAHEYVSASNPMNQVSCLVLEFGEGDLRGKISSRTTQAASWKLAVLRDVALAIDQLHRNGIAHQDIKPSNVISIPTSLNREIVDMKLGDLGRVIRKSTAGPYDELPWPGDFQYSPPERWYGLRPSEWQDKREASDAFMLGSLIFFLFTGVTVQLLLLPQLPELFKPDNWRGGYSQELILVLRDAQAKIISSSLKPNIPAQIADELIEIVRQLTEPDPKLRGDPKARRQIGHPVGMDRFHPRLLHLSNKASINERVGLRGS